MAICIASQIISPICYMRFINVWGIYKRVVWIAVLYFCINSIAEKHWNRYIKKNLSLRFLLQMEKSLFFMYTFYGEWYALKIVHRSRFDHLLAFMIDEIYPTTIAKELIKAMEEKPFNWIGVRDSAIQYSLGLLALLTFGKYRKFSIILLFHAIEYYSFNKALNSEQKLDLEKEKSERMQDSVKYMAELDTQKFE